MTTIKPTQRDKDAAIKLATMIFGNGHSLTAELATAERHFMLDEMARHAAAERALERAAIVEWLRGMTAWHDANDDGWSGYHRIAQGYREAIEAIEAGEHLPDNAEAIARGE